MPAELGVVEALILARKNNCRVTYGAEVVVEVSVHTCEEHGGSCGGKHHAYSWREVGRGATFLDAVKLAVEACLWERA